MISSITLTTKNWPHRLWVRSLPFQGGESGSSPDGATKIWVVCYKVWQWIVNPSGKPTPGSIPGQPTKTHTGVSNKAMLVLAGDCKSLPEEAGCSIQHTPTKIRVSGIAGAYGCLKSSRTRFNSVGTHQNNAPVAEVVLAAAS